MPPATGPDPLEISPRAVWGAAAGTFRRRWPFVIGFTICVFAVLQVAEQFTGVTVERIDARTLVRIVLALLSSGLVLAGTTFSAGVFDHLVADDQHGEPAPFLHEIARRLPYARLVVVAVVYSLAVAFTLAILVIPGLVFLTLWAIVSSAIVIEGRSVWGAFGRSWRVTRRHFWTTFLCVTALLALEYGIEELLHHVHWLHTRPVLAEAVDGLVAASIGAFVALTEVTLAHRLLRRYPEPRTATEQSPPAPPAPGTLGTA